MNIVGIGASAGGLAAMSKLLANIPKDTGAAFVFLQHLSPKSKSIMGELLSKHTDMPVKVVYEDQPVQPNHIYVMAESKNLVFNHGMLITRDRQPDTSINLPIDLFFHSLGENLGQESIGVLLSGTGTDGTRGLRTIKEHGGLVLVQSPESAEFDGMPKAAIDLKIADRVEVPEQLAKDLLGLLKGDRTSSIEEQLKQKGQHPHFERIVELLSGATGIDFSSYRTPTLMRRMGNRMLIRKCDNMKMYSDLLEKDAEELDTLSHDVLIGVTRFFRDPEAFEAIRTEVLPKLFNEPRPANTPYRFWIPACATGEEAYSIAMLIDQYIQQNDLEVEYKIFASDVDEGAVRYAIKGLYSSSMVADTPKDLTAHYFIKEGNEFRVRPFLRKRVLFAVHNLLGDPPFIDMDLISCRNMLIYLKSETQQKVLSTLHFALRKRGVLVLGPSESLGSLKYAFTQIVRKWSIFEKYKEARLRYQSGFNLSKDRSKLSGGRKKKRFSMDYDAYDTDPFTQYLVERYAPISLFVNRDLDLLYINGDAEQLLNMPRALARLNLRKMLDQPEFLTMKAGVEKVLESREPVHYRKVKLHKGETAFNAHLRFALPQLPRVTQDGQEDREDVVLIEIRLFGENEGVEVEAPASDAQEAKEASLQRELQLAKRRSQELVKELETTNEELQTSNRELLASNEELQSTNEELQSVNEELYTVNSELQIKNEELQTAHNDINNLLKSTEIGTIFLDKQLRIRKFTPAVKRQFSLLDSDIGRTITSFSTTFKDLDIDAECQKVFDTLEAFEREVVDESDDHYLMRILPYRTEEDSINGLVITFIDINEMVNTQQRMDKLAKKYKAIFNFSYSIIAVMDVKGEVSSINRPFGPYEPKDLVGQVIFEILPEHLANELRTAFRHAVKAQEPQKLELQIAPDSWFDISLIPNPYVEAEDSEHQLSIIMMGEETTEDKLLVAELESSLHTYKAFMDNAEQQIALVDSEGVIHYINFTSYTGKSKEELQGDSIYAYLPDDKVAKIREAIASIFEGKVVDRIQFSFKYENGKEGEAELIVTPVIIGGKIKYVSLVQDYKMISK
jgi:two-component system CheB/CheR fusion protein